MGFRARRLLVECANRLSVHAFGQKETYTTTKWIMSGEDLVVRSRLAGGLSLELLDQF